MRIDGKEIASEILTQLVQNNTHPHLAIILVGDNPASVSYVRQKILKTEKIGGKATLVTLEPGITNEELRKTIEQLNNDPTIHGIVVQRPLPKNINLQTINEMVSAKKDIDAFRADSPYTMPLAGAVIKILQEVAKLETRNSKLETNTKSLENSNLDIVSDFPTSLDFVSTQRIRISDFTAWLSAKQVVVVGKGETGGGPTIALLRKMGIEPTVIDSKTMNHEPLTMNADIIVSTVGKPNTLKPENLKQGVILIGVGMYRGEDGKLHGDYNEEEIKNIASFYTPIPGGVGPVNVAMLLVNLVEASKK